MGALAAAMTPIQLVNTINTGAGSSNFTPDSPDPSGLAYIPGQDRLVAVDGEVEETTGAGFHGANGWFVTRSGTSTDTFDTTKAPTSPQDKEPVGAAYDIATNELYIVRDGATGRVWVYNATTMALKRTFAVTGPPYNDADDEGLGFGGGILYMVDAKDNDLVKVQPGNDGVVGTSDDQVTNFDLQRYGQTEPEGLDVHPVTGNIWVVSNKLVGGQPEPMVEVTPSGALVASYSIAAANPDSAAGLAIAPPSDGSGGYDIYVSDRGVDNGDNPSENDGHIYEFRVDAAQAPTAGFSWSQRVGSQTVDFTDTSSGLPTQWSWDFGDGMGSSSQNPSHTYANPGMYTVSLTATNNFGSDATTHQVTVTASGSNTNLLQNASFEAADGSGHPSSWTVINEFTRSSDVAHDGTFSGKLVASDANVSTYQTVAVSAGTTYAFSGWVNIPTTGDTFSIKFKVQWRNSSGAISTVVLKKVPDDTGGGWVAVTAPSAVAPAGATSARVLITTDSLIGPAYVDEVWFGQP